MADYSDLKAVFINCTLKKSPDVSNTEGLMKVSQAIMDKQGVATQMIRLVDHDIAHGVYPDMTEHGWERDDWPQIWAHVKAADILVVGTPIWLGRKARSPHADRAPLCPVRRHEREGQYGYYGKVGGCIVTGNEDGIKHVAMSVLYALQHVGYTIPPQADAGWIGEAGPGPSYLDPFSGGPQNDFTQRNTTFMSWNLMHLAALLKRNGGLPAEGNSRRAWDDGARFDHPNPEYR